MNRVFLVGISIGLLVGCDSEQNQEVTKETKEVVPTVTIKEEDEKIVSTEKEVTPLTKQDIDKLFKINPDETQYESGKFKLKDGTEINADYITYVDTEVSEYASIIFFENQIASILLDPTDKSKEEVLEYFGLQDVYKDYEVNEFTKVVRITVDQRFDMDNIETLPSEWN